MVLLGAGAGFIVGRGGTSSRAVSSVGTWSPPVAETAIAVPEKLTYQSFNWRAVESEDIEQFVANLRRIRCPEQTIGDIIRARVFALYQARVNRIFNPLAAYWMSPAEAQAIDGQVKAIRKERDQLLASLNLQLSTGSPVSGVPTEKQRYISEAASLYPKVYPGLDATTEEWQRALEGRRARIGYLSQFLSADELLTYRITQDGNAPGVALLLRDIDATDDEFRKAFSALDGENLSRSNGVLRPDLEARLQQALGDDRYAQYREQSAPENAMFSQFVHSCNLTDQQIRQLKDLRDAADTMTMSQYRDAVAGVLESSVRVNAYFSQPLVYRGKRN